MEKNVSSVAEQDKTAEVKKNPKLIELARPYKFDDKEYTEIDLSGLDDLTIKDAVLIIKKLYNEGEMAVMITPETATACRLSVLWFAFSTIPIVRKWERASERSGMRITSRSVERNNVTGMTTTIRRAKPLNNTMEIAETMKKKSTGMQKRPSVKIWTSLLVGT